MGAGSRIITLKRRNMKKVISTKMRWVSDGGWNGRAVPIHAVCAANDTGSFSDSPCPSTLREREMKRAKAILRKAGIYHRSVWGVSSNIFLAIQYLVTAPEDKERAKELIGPIVDGCELLYLIK